MIAAYRELERLERRDAAMAERPVAQLATLLANIHRDTTKRAQPFALTDFTFYGEDAPADGISPTTAAVALDLRREGLCPELLLAAWPEILRAATPDAKAPEIRALRSDDGAVWVLAPKFETGGIRAGLAVVRGQLSGKLRLQELDRPMMSHALILPQRQGFGWLEANVLLRLAS